MARSHDELLEEARLAHEAYVSAVEGLRAKRREAFIRASHGAVRNREIAEATRLSESMVGKIIKGER